MLRVSILLIISAILAILTTSTQGFRIYGLNYGTRTYDDGCKPTEMVKKELAEVAKLTDRIRIFSLDGCDNGLELPALAKEAGLKLWLGMWVCGEEECFNKNYDYLEKMVKKDIFTKYADTIVGMHVGSEAIYRKEVDADQSIAYLEKTRKYLSENKISLPLTIADIVDTYISYPQLIEAVDIVSANIFTFWENIPVEEADCRLRNRLAALEKETSSRNKKFMIGETGWSEKGENENASETSLENAVKYFKIFTDMAREEDHQWQYYYFSAIDEPWKQWSDPDTDPADSVEPWFGLMTEKAVLKDGYAEHLSNDTMPVPPASAAKCSDQTNGNGNDNGNESPDTDSSDNDSQGKDVDSKSDEPPNPSSETSKDNAEKEKEKEESGNSATTCTLAKSILAVSTVVLAAVI